MKVIKKFENVRLCLNPYLVSKETHFLGNLRFTKVSLAEVPWLLSDYSLDCCWCSVLGTALLKLS